MSDIDLKYLERILEREQKAPLPKSKRGENKDVIKFIRKTGLAPGENKVPTYLIYYTFIKWCKKYWINQWKKEEFFRTFKQHFQLKRSGNQRFYLINDAIDLSEEAYEKAKKYDQKYKNKVQKRKS